VFETTAVTPDRTARRREAAKNEILDAAWALIRQHGLAGLSMRDLAARVGLRAPSLYQYFPSKDAIYDALFEQGATQALEAMTEPPITTTDTRAALRESAHRLFDFATSDPPRAQLLYQRTLPGFEPSVAAYAPAMQMWERAQALLAAHGITGPYDMDLWTALISGLINQQLSNDPGGSRWARLVDRTVDLFLADVAPSAS
jgi:AcrR family transcriptional regulator